MDSTLVCIDLSQRVQSDCSMYKTYPILGTRCSTGGFRMSSKEETIRCHVLVMCLFECELQVALSVLNNKCGQTLQDIYLRSGLRLEVYSGWNFMPLVYLSTVARILYQKTDNLCRCLVYLDSHIHI